jgi:hypothetical protein
VPWAARGSHSIAGRDAGRRTGKENGQNHVTESGAFWFVSRLSQPIVVLRLTALALVSFISRNFNELGNHFTSALVTVDKRCIDAAGFSGRTAVPAGLPSPVRSNRSPIYEAFWWRKKENSFDDFRWRWSRVLL